MAIATRIPRYNKLQKLYIDEKEVTLIEHLQHLRTSNKITKKRISNIIKQNDTWYSQIERNGKNGDDNRQKTIYRPDLINIISIVKYGANSISELGEYHDKSEVYLDKIIKAVPLEESMKQLEWYQINNKRTPDEQYSLFNSLLDSINKSLKQSFENLPGADVKDDFLDCLKEINASLKLDTCFLIKLAGLPFSEFLYEADQNRIDQLLTDVQKIIDDIEKRLSKDNTVKHNMQYYEEIRDKLKKYTDLSKFTRRTRFEFLDDDEIRW